jgi:hypothetical protein
MIVFKVGALAIFVHGFAKSEVENVGPDELAALKKLASEMLAYAADPLEKAVASGTLMEVQCDGKHEAVS